MRSRELDWKRRQILDARLRHEVLVLDAYPPRQLRPVQSRLGGENFALEQLVVPHRVQMRELVRLQPDAVAEVVLERLAERLLQVRRRRFEDVATERAR